MQVGKGGSRDISWDTVAVTQARDDGSWESVNHRGREEGWILDVF